MKTLIIPIFLLVFAINSGLSQKSLSTSQLIKQAEEFEKIGKYGQAGDNFEAAWRDKPKKLTYLYSAAENYNRARDYEKASRAYSKLSEFKTSDSFLGLKYARALKQNGQNKEAIAAFRSFINNYSGDGKTVLEEIIAIEIAGCEIAMTPNPGYVIQHGGSELNTSFNELSPLLLSKDLLYFTSTQGNLARIYRSVKVGSRWSKGVAPENFPVITSGQYAYGSLTPDGARFYFSICEPKANLTPGSTRCEIFVIQRRGVLWTSPVRLPESINLPGMTATQPFVVHENNREYIYFSSNRPGGSGLMDLWFTYRQLNSEAMSFSDPINLGPEINTLGDDIAPFYDVQEKKLYYASNGKVSMGGYDILIAEGSGTEWLTPINPGPPLNSPADDVHFFKLSDNSTGFLSSNRKWEKDKTSTRDDDLFEIVFRSNQVFLQAGVYDLETTELIKKGRVRIFEKSNSTQKLLYNEALQNGKYKFLIESDKTYRIELESEGLVNASYEITTNNPNLFAYGQDIFLEKISTSTTPPVIKTEPTTPPVVKTEPTTPPVVKTEPTTPPVVKTEPETPPVVKTEPTTPPVVKTEPTKIQSDNSYYNGRAIIGNYRPGEVYLARGTSRLDQLLYQATSPRYQGVYFKIQLLALNQPNLNSSVFNQVRSVGQLETEYLVDRNLSRVLIGDFFTVADANGALQIVKNLGFKDAYLVRYEDGNRFGRINP
jgi:hypothetical protein